MKIKQLSFRSAAVESEWNKAVNFIKNDKTLKKRNTAVLSFIIMIFSR
jgi:hypothetical protein